MATRKKESKVKRTISLNELSSMSTIYTHDVAQTGGEIVITNLDGLPLAKLAPLGGEAGKAAMEYENRPRKLWIGRDRHNLQYYGDLDDPDDTDLTPARSRLDDD